MGKAERREEVKVRRGRGTWRAPRMSSIRSAQPRKVLEATEGFLPGITAIMLIP